jgi:hypothetical protein
VLRFVCRWPENEPDDQQHPTDDSIASPQRKRGESDEQVDKHQKKQESASDGHSSANGEGNGRRLGFLQLVLHFQLCEGNFMQQEIFCVGDKTAEERGQTRICT